mmetsp:Transcript_39223/g.63693  ORF Transcript_39223/g.63693 Transcript_39223/m.63693 type:complete len:156 (-) Transcript_39223:1181-1648(-)
MIVVPLPASCPNTTYQSSIRDALVTLTKEYDLSGTNSLELVFGDLHLKEIKDWRTKSFPEYHCKFPLFGQSYASLQELLFTETDIQSTLPKITISASNNNSIVTVGQEFTRELCDTLQHTPNIDAFGECGEFHTHVQFVPEMELRLRRTRKIKAK